LSNFERLGLSPSLTKELARAGFAQPTPIQIQSIPLALKGHDILGLAQTGTGKTLAFGLPMIDRLIADPGRPAPKSPKALVLAPTRELANQIADSLRPMVQATPLRIATVVGGQSINRQIATLLRGIDIPGVAHVINYDLPNVAEAYVHRIGRTARAGREGAAISFCSPEERGLLREIEKLVGRRFGGQKAGDDEEPATASRSHGAQRPATPHRKRRRRRSKPVSPAPAGSRRVGKSPAGHDDPRAGLSRMLGCGGSVQTGAAVRW